MKNLFKYLIPVFLGIIIGWCCGECESGDAESGLEKHAVVAAVSGSGISSPDSEFCLPRTVSFANSQRVQTGARRTNTINRNSLEFTKAGKVMNAGIRYFVQNKSILVHSSLLEPSHRLLYLGKLII